MLLSKFSLTCLYNSRHIAFDYNCADWDDHDNCDGFHHHLRYVSWKDIINLGTFTAACEFYDLVPIQIGIYILHRKNQVKHHSSP